MDVMDTTALDPNRVLSIQSHVVSGYVGNRAATFPLQTLGYDVDVVNTVQFANHTGYGFTDGHKTTPEQLSAIFHGLTVNGLLGHGRILTGYIPGAEALNVVAGHISKMKQERPDIIYVLDPVMGDIGTGLYVSEDVVPIYKSMLGLATVITPNQFEAELLSGISITDMPSLYTALDRLHSDNCLQHVALSSIPLPASLVRSLDLPQPPSVYSQLLPTHTLPWYHSAEDSDPEDDILVCLASTKLPDSLPETWAFALPTVQGYFSGVGDLFSAMVQAHYRPNASSPASALAEAVSCALLAVQRILLRTHLHSLSQALISGSATPRPLHPRKPESVIPTDNELDSATPHDPRDPKRKAKRMRLRELRVVQERHLLTSDEGWTGRKIDWTLYTDLT